MEFRVLRHQSVDSTSERAFAALAEGSARHGDVHVAREQTRGRGRRGASWSSPADEGLYMSVVLLPQPPPLHPAGLTAAAGLAVYDAAKALGFAHVRLKWPNDVLVRDAKLCGVLVETRGLDPRAPHYVIGIGVNVAQRNFAAELVAERAVTSLALEGIAMTVDETLQTVLAHLGPRIEQVRGELEQLSDAFVDAAHLRNARVRLEYAAQTLDGRLAAFSLERGVAVERDDGSVVRCAVEHVRALTRVA